MARRDDPTSRRDDPMTRRDDRMARRDDPLASRDEVNESEAMDEPTSPARVSQININKPHLETGLGMPWFPQFIKLIKVLLFGNYEDHCHVSNCYIMQIVQRHSRPIVQIVLKAPKLAHM